MRRLAALLVLALAPAAARADEAVVAVGGLVQPFAVDFDSRGRMLVVEMAKGERLLAVEAGRVTTLAGKLGVKGNAGDDGPAAAALFDGPHHLAVGPGDRVFVADTFNNRIRVVGRDGTIRAFAGTGEKGYAGDDLPGPAARFGAVYCLGLTPDKTKLYVADLDNRRVRRIDVGSTLVTGFAGTGKAGVPKDGEPAATQPLVDPRAVAADALGNVYILERNGHALRVVDDKGVIRTVAGTGKPGTAVGPALKSQFNGPKHLCCAPDGTVFIADTENHRVVRYDPKANTVTAVAGTGKKGPGGAGGDPLKLELDRPHGVTVHPTTGRLFIADSGNGRVVEITRGARE